MNFPIFILLMMMFVMALRAIEIKNKFSKANSEINRLKEKNKQVVEIGIIEIDKVKAENDQLRAENEYQTAKRLAHMAAFMEATAKLESLQLTIDQLREDKKAAEKVAFTWQNAAIEVTKKLDLAEAKLLKTLEHLDAFRLPDAVLPQETWTEQDEAGFSNMLKCEIGLKFMRHMEEVEQYMNRHATGIADPLARCGEARGFRMSLYRIKELCGTPQPNTGENTSDTEKSPSESAEQFRA